MSVDSSFFQFFLNIAKDLNLPIVIHSRGAWRECFEKMTDFGMELKEGQIKSTTPNVGKVKDVEAQVDAAVEKLKSNSKTHVFIAYADWDNDILTKLGRICYIKIKKPKFD